MMTRKDIVAIPYETNKQKREAVKDLRHEFSNGKITVLKDVVCCENYINEDVSAFAY